MKNTMLDFEHAPFTTTIHETMKRIFEYFVVRKIAVTEGTCAALEMAMQEFLPSTDYNCNVIKKGDVIAAVSIVDLYGNVVDFYPD